MANLPMAYELAARRIGWLQAAVKLPAAHEQFVASVFGTMIVEGKDWVVRLPALDGRGHISEDAPGKLALAHQEALLVYEGISGTESFYECWDGPLWEILEVPVARSRDV